MKGKRNSLILAAAGNRILQCSECLEQHLYGDAAKHLAGLIGLGIGLTPSGDDFLCGVLAGLILRGGKPSICARFSAGDNFPPV